MRLKYSHLVVARALVCSSGTKCVQDVVRLEVITILHEVIVCKSLVKKIPLWQVPLGWYSFTYIHGIRQHHMALKSHVGSFLDPFLLRDVGHITVSTYASRDLFRLLT